MASIQLGLLKAGSSNFRVFCGFFTVILGITLQSVCACPDGEVYDVVMSKCIPCPVGTFKSGDTDVCELCPVGMVTLDTGSTNASQCDVGMFNTTRCPPGHHWHGVIETCEVCPLGTYNPGSNDYICIQCPYRTTTQAVASTDKSQCLEMCPAGSERMGTNEPCLPCRIGMYRSGDSFVDHCVPCPDSMMTLYEGATDESACVHMSSPANIFNPMECPLGTHWSMEDEACIKCPQGTFSSYGGCMNCTQGLTTLYAGAKYPETCMPHEEIQYMHDSAVVRKEINCPIGTEFVRKPLGCQACPLGTYRSELSQPQCVLCPNRTTTPSIGAYTVHMCHGDFVMDIEGSNGLADCPSGTSWDHFSFMCKACPHGSYRNAKSTSSSCIACPDGATTAHEGATSYMKCVVPIPQSALEKNPFFNQDCPPGTEWSTYEQGCRVCPQGFYRTGHTTFCQPCPNGYTTVSAGITSIAECFVRMGHPSTFAITQDGCGPGYAPDLHNTTCIACPNRTYKSEYGFQDCESCPYTRHGVPATTSTIGATSQLFCLVDMFIEEISPVRVLETGGSTLTLYIQSNASEIRIDSAHTLAGVHCEITDVSVRHGMLHCVTRRSRQPGRGPVVIYPQSWSIWREFISSQMLRVVENPAVRNMSRNTVFVGGGTYVGFHVDNANSAVTTNVMFYHPHNENFLTQPCTVTGHDSIRCLTPDLSDWFSHNRKKRSNDETTRVQMGLIFDDWWFYANLSLIAPSISTLTIVENPVIWNISSVFGTDTIVQMEYSNRTSLVMQGSRLMNGANVDDYNISVGQVQCYVTLLSDATIECDFLPNDYRLLARNIKHDIKVAIGNLLYEPGSLEIMSKQTDESKAVKEKEDNNYVIMLAISLTIVAILTLIIACACCWYTRGPINRLKKQKSVYAGSWQSLHSTSTSSSISAASHSTARLPPLPVNSVFGPDRRGDKDKFTTMRPLALPHANFHKPT